MRTLSSVLHRTRQVAVAMALCGAGVLATGGPAIADTKPSAGEIRLALDRIADDTWTEADIALLKRVPEVGHSVPDPRDRGTLTAMPARPIPPSEATKSTVRSPIQCWSQWSYVEKMDIFDTRIYRFNIETDWCYNTLDGSIASLDRAIGYIDNETWGIYFRGYQYDQYAIRQFTHGSAFHDKKAIVEYCVAGEPGCYTVTYPTIHIEIGSLIGPNPWNWKATTLDAG
jgi:hypothetical protein